MSITLNGTTGITTPDVTAESYTGPLAVNASAPDDSVVVDASGNVGVGTGSPGAKLGLIAKGKRWYNNGQNIVFCLEGMQPEGYILGRQSRMFCKEK